MKTKGKRHSLIYNILFVGIVTILTTYSLNFDWINNKLLNRSPNRKSSSEEKVGVEKYERQEDTDTWTLYQNKLIGYEIRFPSNWKISEESFEPDGNGATEQSNLIDIYPGDIEKDFLMKITIEGFVTGLDPDGNVSSDNVWESYLNNFKSWNLEDKKISDIEINGTKFTLVTGNSTDSGTFRSKAYLTKINKGKGTLAIIIRDKASLKSEIFDQIVETFKLQ